MRRAGLAPVGFVLLWSTGFVGARYGLPYAAPFTFLAVRLAIAGVLLAGLAGLAGLASGSLSALSSMSLEQVRHASVAGLLLHAGYLGGVFYAIADGLPASVAAVVVSLQPLLTAALATRLLDEHLVGRQWVGLGVGVAGVALVLAPGLSAGQGAYAPVAVLACVVALIAGSAGTLWQKRHGDRIPLLTGTAVQYGAAALLLLVLALATEDTSIRWTPRFVVAMVWLVVALSLGAILLLLLMLRRGSAASVSSLFYLVPPATALESYLVFGEQLKPLSLLGIGVTAVGVALVLRPPKVGG